MQRYCVFSSIIISMLCVFLPTCVAGTSLEKVLPAPACTEGWVMEGGVTLYTKDTLFERINGESELYLPYGFEVLASARYADRKDPRIAVEVDVYTMGSLLDAFGIYSNYRRPEDTMIKIGTEGFISPSQLLFYQDRYFVRLHASGTLSLGQDIFLACAQAVSLNLQQNGGRPKELEAFMLPAVVAQKSVRYIAQSLLGYSFFRRGLTADAVLGDEPVKVFLVTEDSPESARKALDRYGSYLRTAGHDVRMTDAHDHASLTAADPLYGMVFVELSDRYLIGVVKVNNVSAAKQLVEQMKRRVVGHAGG